MNGGQQRAPGFLPMRGLARVLTILLAVALALVAARLAIQLLWVGSVFAPAWSYSLVSQLDKVADIAFIGLSVLFVVWFRRARINAEGHGYRQRRARGWTFWGWIVPIVNLWFPFQIMGDIWRAGLPAPDRRKTAWLPALWWTCWLLSGLSYGDQAVSSTGIPRMVSSTAVSSTGIPHMVRSTAAVSLLFLGIAGAALIGIIRTVSSGPVGSPLS